MKRALFLVILIVISIETYGQNILLRQIKGKWSSESVCIIAFQVPLNIPSIQPENINRPVIMVSLSSLSSLSSLNDSSIIATKWLIDNYHFDIRIVKFLSVQTFKVKSNNSDVSHLIAKGKYTYDEANEKITLRNLRMETNKCNRLSNFGTTTYSVMMVRDKLMVWYPDDAHDYTKAYLESIRWRK